MQKYTKKIKSTILNLTQNGWFFIMPIAAVCLVIALLSAIYYKMPIIYVNDNSYTYADISVINADINKLSDISGKDAKSKRLDVFNQLVLGALEKELVGKLVKVDKTLAMKEFIDLGKSPYSGFFNKRFSQMGEDRFYKLYVEPIYYNSAFIQYYTANDPNTKTVSDALAELKQIDLATYAAKYKLAVKDETIPLNANTQRIYNDLKSAGVNKTLVQEGAAFNITNIKDITDNAIKIQYVSIQRTPLNVFLLNEIKKKNVVLKFSPISIYRQSDLEKPGYIFSK